ncbi:hypothetical protein EYF80_023754 [Liparis tanakae]|uniref:Uncharacterized protein n=1 Tax=Liparis tanakae TaxID=230148 RepID=A0A4Z2HJK8_9TELE|nr:hypothetical protein EYF80_023754 [Liparis tanakae]
MPQVEPKPLTPGSVRIQSPRTRSGPPVASPASPKKKGEKKKKKKKNAFTAPRSRPNACETAPKPQGGGRRRHEPNAGHSPLTVWAHNIRLAGHNTQTNASRKLHFISRQHEPRCSHRGEIKRSPEFCCERLAFCRSYALAAALTRPRPGVRGQEGVTSEVFMMTLARISCAWLAAADAGEFWP